MLVVVGLPPAQVTGPPALITIVPLAVSIEVRTLDKYRSSTPFDSEHVEAWALDAVANAMPASTAADTAASRASSGPRWLSIEVFTAVSSRFLGRRREYQPGGLAKPCADPVVS